MSYLGFLARWAATTWFGILHQEKYCPEWDKALGRLLDKHGADAHVGAHTTTLGSYEVWTSNAFYAYGHVYGSDLPKRRPGLWNMYRLHWYAEAKRAEYKAKKRREYAAEMENIGNG